MFEISFIIVAFWLLIGLGSTIWLIKMDAEKGRDFRVGDLGLALTGVCLGPIAFIIGLVGIGFTDKIIIKGKKYD
jgi:hypothetical protein